MIKIKYMNKQKQAFKLCLFSHHSGTASLAPTAVIYNAMLYTYCLQVSQLYLIPRMEKFY